MDDIEDTIRKHTLRNALFYDGKAQKGAVLGKVMAEMPELRSRGREIAAMLDGIIAQVNGMTVEDIRAELEAKDPALTRRPTYEKRSLELPDLEGAQGGVVMRFAPSPSGPLHIGHSRAAILNDEYVKRYGGKFILRLEDTNPENILEDAYRWIPEDLGWLGVEVHVTVVQSDRFDLYLEHARRVLETGGAYICDCDVEEWRELKVAGRPCPHRDLPAGEQLAGWEKMLDGGYASGEASMVVRTDLAHPNPAVRDFVGYRIVDAPHPRTGDKYRLYPMYNFSVVIDDHEMGMTHVLRGKDHLNNTIRQKYLYEHLGWEPPRFTHYGWVSIKETILKTTTIKEGIAAGEFTGWDDTRLGTFRSLARRGYDPESLRRYWREVGVTDVDINFSWETLDAMDRDIHDDRADRYFFVADPVEMSIADADALECRAPLHPGHPERGSRDYTLTSEGGFIIVAVSGGDRDAASPGGRVRLKDLCNLEIREEGAAAYIGNDLSLVKKGVPIIHWVPVKGAVEGALHMTDGSVVKGLFEPLLMDALAGGGPRVVQLERVGFANLHPVEGRIEGAFLHK